MEEDSNQKKTVKHLGRLTPELLEKTKGSGPSYGDYLDSLPKNDIEGPAGKDQSERFSFDLGLKEKPFVMPDLNSLELSIAQIRELSDDDLLRLLSGEGHHGLIRDPIIHLISNEILSREIKESSKPHWTIKPTFYAVIFFGLISVVMGVLSLLR